MPKIKINNIKINYKIFGEENHETILFIHGLGSSFIDWEKQIPFFEKNYKLIIPDLRNHGNSDKSDEVSVEILANDLLELLDKLKISHVNIVGLSLGGMVAFQMAVSSPRLLEKLIIVNAIPKFSLISIKEKFLFYSRIAILQIFGIRILAKFLAKKLFPKKIQEKLRQKFFKRFQKNDKKSYYNILKSLLNFNVEDKLDKIESQTLFVSSNHDYFSLAKKRNYVKKIKNAKLIVVADSYHALPAEKPEEFNEIISQFIDGR